MCKTLYTERDNLGTRQETARQADRYWTARLTCQQNDPFILYTFEHDQDAREALLALPCIHTAEDSGKLICTEVLDFGVHPTEHLASVGDGPYAAVLAGADLTDELWFLAMESFQSHGGRRKNDQKPEPKRSTTRSVACDRDDVVFLREDRQSQSGCVLTYRVHKASTAAAAQMFLQRNPVTKPLYYLIVETPEGNYCRDRDGMYKE